MTLCALVPVRMQRIWKNLHPTSQDHFKFYKSDTRTEYKPAHSKYIRLVKVFLRSQSPTLFENLVSLFTQHGKD